MQLCIAALMSKRGADESSGTGVHLRRSRQLAHDLSVDFWRVLASDKPDRRRGDRFRAVDVADGSTRADYGVRKRSFGQRPSPTTAACTRRVLTVPAISGHS